MFEEREGRWRAWMTAAQAGDSEAYERLLGELLPYLRGFVARRLRDPDGAEDVVQNTLVSIHRARHTYRPERPFAPWLHAVARNAVIDALRSGERRARREVPCEMDEVADPLVSLAPGERVALSPELSGALEELPESQRQAVELLHVEGLSVAEAARRVGITPGALKVRAHRGYRALRARLGGKAP